MINEFSKLVGQLRTGLSIFSARCSAKKHFACLLLVFLSAISIAARADQIVYDDALENGWQDWGWATHSYTNTSPVHSGIYSCSVTISSGWQGLQLWHANINSSAYTSISFWLNGGTSGGQHLQVYGLVNINGTNGFSLSQRYALAAPPANGWQQYSVSLSSFGVANITNFAGFVIQDSIGSAEPIFYVDDISVVSTGVVTTASGPVGITVDAQANRHAISPQIYGTAFASSNQLQDLNFTMNRSGGNNETSYNWSNNINNLDFDWYFESLPAGSPRTPGASADDFVANSKNGGAQAMITIPMIDWGPKLGTNGDGRLDSYSVAKYGPQVATDPYWSDAGNGMGTNTTTHTSWLITTNDPNDAYMPVNSAFQSGYVQHLINNWGASTNGGVGIYLMDNEHSIWFSTHQDVHPVGPTMQEIFGRIVNYASMVKSNDPNALVCAPEEWGWNGYFYSGYDQQWSGQHNDYNSADYPDRAANGGMDYMPWLLNQLHQHDTNTGVRLLDYFTLHCYPQEGSVGTSATDATTVALRNQSTRQFWDPSYVDPSWINNIIMLIPRMKSWVTNYYPGTKIGVTEYNWGAEPDISGATAQADILGIFGREGLDLATRWETPDASTPTYLAMKIYRNYDGNKSTFGDTSVSATGPNPDYVSTFAATRSTDGALTIMAINKQIGSNTPVFVTLTNFLPSGVAHVWQLTSANVITNLSDLAFTGGTFSNTLPAQSVTLFILPAGTPPSLQSGAMSSTNTFSFWLNGQTNQHYAILYSSNLLNWQPVQTNSLAGNPVQIVLPATNVETFYRAQWLP
jgi:Glycoside hydrolase family 44